MLRVAEYFASSDTGRQRRHNEDAHFERAPLFVVADGMGGAQAGEVASHMAVESFSAGLPDDDAMSDEERLRTRIREANERIHEVAQRDRERMGMGTTITAAVVGEREVAVAHVGDSRAYRLRGDAFERLTEDHSLVEELMRQGKLTPEEASEHPQRSIITRALGPEPDVDVDSRTWPGAAGDVFLLCSDGLTSMIDEAAVEAVLREAGDLEAAGRALVAAANEAGGRDNITVVLFRLEEVEAGGGGAGDGGAGGEQATMVGAPADGLRTTDVQAALAEAEEARARRIEPRAPRGAVTGEEPARERSRGRRAAITLGIVALVVIPLGLGAFIATQAVWFVGTDEQGFVSLYRGLPYELPLGIDLYERVYASGVSVTALPPARRERLLDHTLRSRDDAADLIRRLETGELSLR